MIKYALLFISSISLTLTNLFFLQGVEINHNIPEYLAPGKTYDVDVILTKSSITGFAKFQLELPDGINVIATENQGSTFTFKKGIVKNIWMEIPEGEEVILSYKFEITPEFSQSSIVKGRLFYIYNNEKMTTEIDPFAIKPGEDPSQIKSIAGSEEKPKEKVELNRKIRSLANNEFEVTLTVAKTGIEGFAKVQEELPKDFNALPIKTSESVFSVVDGKAKFIWFNVPEDSILTVSYILNTSKSVTEKTVLAGTFSYMRNEEAIEIDLPYEKLIYHIDPMEYASEDDLLEETEDVLEDSVVADVDATELDSGNTETTETDIVSNLPPVKEQLDEEEQETDTLLDSMVALEEETDNHEDQQQENETEEVDTYASSDEESVEDKMDAADEDPMQVQTGIFYRVQLAAGHNNVDVERFKKKHSFSREIYLENHEGWVKYTTGNYDQYRSARDRREEIRAGYQFYGPFVTAYNSGERITVQEALLISKQKWVK